MRFHFPRTEPFPGVTASDWNSPAWQFKNALTSAGDFALHFDLSEAERAALNAGPAFQVRSTPYYAALAARGETRDPIRRMILPTREEFSGGGQQMADPLGEDRHSPR